MSARLENPPQPAAGRSAGWRAHAELALWRHGLAWPLVLGVLLAAALLAQAGLALERQAAAVPRGLAPAAPRADAAAADPSAARESALRALLPPAEEATASVRRLVELTRPQLAWQRAEFQNTDDEGTRLLRVQITVPVNGRYAAMRAALDRSLLELPHLSLDQVLLHREKLDSTDLEARLRFSLWFRLAGGGAR
ncbi:MAG: hypothetical protein U1F50_20925 [Rubrivivax sp.]